MMTETKIFAALGVLIVVIAGIYWWTSYEDAGTTMLLLAGLLGLMIATYLWRHDRQGDTDDGTVGSTAPANDAEQPWLPHVSIWPFWIGIGALLIGNGLILGSWFLIPGGLVFALGIGGYAAESRARR
jgi:hypothetical protein